MNNLLPLFKWSGGKRNEIKFFNSYYPKKIDLFIEPFVGAGAVFFDSCFEKNVINDIHFDLINFYKEIQIGNGCKIYDLMLKYNNDEETYYYIRDKYIPKNNTEKAFVFYYLRKTCFRGMLRYSQKGHFNIPFGRYKNMNFDVLINNQYNVLFNNTTIMNVSFEEVFNIYDNENNFMFLDPPYDSNFTDYGFSSFGKKEHLLLFDCFKNTKNKCLLVIGETPFIKSLYSPYIKSSFHKNYLFKIYNNRISNEINNNHLIIVNY